MSAFRVVVDGAEALRLDDWPAAEALRDRLRSEGRDARIIIAPTQYNDHAYAARDEKGRAPAR